MKILITNIALGDMPGGSEWHAHELSLAMKRKGCDVDVYTISPGWFTDSLKTHGIACYTEPPIGDYDLIIASHSPTIDNIDRSKTTGRIVQICHGKFSDLEYPCEKADTYVSISKEVQEYLKQNGFDSVVIHNGVDHKKFLSNNNGEGILSLCQGGVANDVIEKACSILDVEFTKLNKFDDYVYNLQDEIPKYHTVISLGRGAFEAMACNKRLIVADSRDYVSKTSVMCDGLVSLDNVGELMKNNCSGRRFSEMVGVSEMTDMIARSLSSENPNLRNFSEVELNIDKQADKYLNII